MKTQEQSRDSYVKYSFTDRKGITHKCQTKKMPKTEAEVLANRLHSSLTWNWGHDSQVKVYQEPTLF
jgi:hypothetical protein